MVCGRISNNMFQLVGGGEGINCMLIEHVCFAQYRRRHGRINVCERRRDRNGHSRYDFFFNSIFTILCTVEIINIDVFGI